MSETVHCISCNKEFIYESEILTGPTKNIDGKEETGLGGLKGFFLKKKPKLMNTLLECPHCKKENYYKVIVE